MKEREEWRGWIRFNFEDEREMSLDNKFINKVLYFLNNFPYLFNISSRVPIVLHFFKEDSKYIFLMKEMNEKNYDINDEKEIISLIFVLLNYI